jgi:hypothetical protein
VKRNEKSSKKIIDKVSLLFIIKRGGFVRRKANQSKAIKIKLISLIAKTVFLQCSPPATFMKIYLRFNRCFPNFSLPHPKLSSLILYVWINARRNKLDVIAFFL